MEENSTKICHQFNIFICRRNFRVVIYKEFATNIEMIFTEINLSRAKKYNDFFYLGSKLILVRLARKMNYNNADSRFLLLDILSQYQ